MSEYTSSEIVSDGNENNQIAEANIGNQTQNSEISNASTASASIASEPIIAPAPIATEPLIATAPIATEPLIATAPIATEPLIATAQKATAPAPIATEPPIKRKIPLQIQKIQAKTNLLPLELRKLLSKVKDLKKKKKLPWGPILERNPLKENWYLSADKRSEVIMRILNHFYGRKEQTEKELQELSDAELYTIYSEIMKPCNKGQKFDKTTFDCKSINIPQEKKQRLIEEILKNNPSEDRLNLARMNSEEFLKVLNAKIPCTDGYHYDSRFSCRKKKQPPAAQIPRVKAAQPTRVKAAQPTRVKAAQPTRVKAAQPTRVKAAQQTRVRPAQTRTISRTRQNQMNITRAKNQILKVDMVEHYLREYQKRNPDTTKEEFIEMVNKLTSIDDLKALPCIPPQKRNPRTFGCVKRIRSKKHLLSSNDSDASFFA